MISLNINDLVFGKPELKVCVAGDYNDTDLVLVYNENIEVPIAQYQAYYVKYGVDYPSEPYIVFNYKLTNSQESPFYIDYDVYGLHKEKIVVKGNLILVNYYKNYDIISKEYSDLVVREHREYLRDENGLAIKRNQKTEWIMMDESVGLTKNTIKYYNQTEAIQEGIDRRTNIIDETKVYCINNIGLNYSFDLLNTVSVYVSLFKDGYTAPLREAISALVKPYLTTELKNEIVNILTLE
jgi:hypothetical protein